MFSSSAPPTVLVTGGAGFIGAYFTLTLLHLRFDVQALYNF
jgi:nucleoside-diphosphate-sugar epimerase